MNCFPFPSLWTPINDQSTQESYAGELGTHGRDKQSWPGQEKYPVWGKVLWWPKGSDGLKQKKVSGKDRNMSTS